MVKYYAGVGSRRTPDPILDLMVKIAERLASEGWILRSGHAPGADQAFERGAGVDAEVFLPWSNFEGEVPLNTARVIRQPTDEAYLVAARFHPTWYSLGRGGKALMARNSHQVLGLDLRTRVQMLVCWTPGGRGEGGTGQAIRIAEHHSIPVFDLAVGTHFERLTSFVAA